ncbi:MAG: PilZ domain-containing protein [Nitrospira sp.]|nr:MAG: PilZ domain-containing protein [Nitrospira sp.]
MQPLAGQSKRERDKAELRQQTRYRVEFPISCTGDCITTGTVYNLGLGGCKIMSATRVAMEIGAILKLELRPPQLAPIHVYAATVRWTMEDDFGVDFLGMQESERDRLVQWLEQLAEES